MTALLEAILAKCGRGDCPDDKWPDAQGDYWPLSPLRRDTHSGSFSIGPKGYIDFATSERGSLRSLAGRLGVDVLMRCSRDKKEDISSGSATVAAYAAAKALPVGFLRSLGLFDRKYRGESAVGIPYYDASGQEVATRYRVALAGKDKFRWASGSRAMPYGLWRLDDARRAGYVLLVEGESDAHTLWHHGLPALGIPGASTWKAEWAAHLDGLTVYVWCEPDAGGDAFVNRVGASLPDARIIAARTGRKDVSECHCLGDDVPALVGDLMASARPYRELAAERASAQAGAARTAAQGLLHTPDILEAFAGYCCQRGLVGETGNAQLLYLLVTSRLLDKPVSAVVKGPSSGGKSFTVETVLGAFPTSAYYVLSGMSERALAYSQEPLAHRTLVLYEAAGLTSDFGSYLLRTLLSEGRIRYETVEKTADGLVPRLIERQGPTGCILTTTWASLHPENETRLLSLVVKDTPQQTASVLETLADRANGRVPAEPDAAPWHALQTWLELAGCREVTIPYAHELARLSNPAAVRLRRDFGAVLNLIRAHAVLHQCTRSRDGQGRIVATAADYAAVYRLVADLVAEGVQATVSPTVRETVQAVARLSRGGQEPASVTELARALAVDKAAASRRARVATELGYIANLEDRRGKPARLIPGEPLPEDRPVLPSPETLRAAMAETNMPADTPASTRQHVNTSADADTEPEPF